MLYTRTIIFVITNYKKIVPKFICMKKNFEKEDIQCFLK